MGLLVLRVAAGGAAAGQGGLFLAHGGGPDSGAASPILGVLAMLGGFGLIAGCFTPGAAMVASLSTLLIAAIWTPPVSDTLSIDGPAVALIVIDAIALALLGPGAHSVDAYLFGRREIIIPADSSHR